MPMVTIKLVAGCSRENKDEMARRVAVAVSETSGIAPESIWVVFDEVQAEDWFVGTDSVAARRRAKAG
jgi:4-oxalocrotonate tautomerase